MLPVDKRAFSAIAGATFMSCSGIFAHLADHELTPEQFWELKREGEDELRLVKVE